MNSQHKWPVTRKMCPLDDVIMIGYTILNSSIPGRCYSNFKRIIFKLIVQNIIWGIHNEVALRWINRISLMRGQHTMMTSSNGNISALLAFCVRSTKASVAELRCFSFDMRLNKWLSKQSLGWWFEAPSRSLWRHVNGVRKWLKLGVVRQPNSACTNADPDLWATIQ